MERTVFMAKGDIEGQSEFGDIMPGAINCPYYWTMHAIKLKCNAQVKTIFSDYLNLHFGFGIYAHFRYRKKILYCES